MDQRQLNNVECVIVVGSDGSQYVRDICRLLEGLGISFEQCANIYTATIELFSRIGHEELLICGKLDELSRENFRFFEICKENNVRCFCLFEKSNSTKGRMLRALKSGVLLLGDIGQLATAIKDTAGQSTAQGKGAVNSRKIVSDNKEIRRDEAALSQAEMNALLGSQQVDDYERKFDNRSE